MFKKIILGNLVYLKMCQKQSKNYYSRFKKWLLNAKKTHRSKNRIFAKIKKCKL